MNFNCLEINRALPNEITFSQLLFLPCAVLFVLCHFFDVFSCASIAVFPDFFWSFPLFAFPRRSFYCQLLASSPSLSFSIYLLQHFQSNSHIFSVIFFFRRYIRICSEQTPATACAICSVSSTHSPKISGNWVIRYFGASFFFVLVILRIQMRAYGIFLADFEKRRKRTNALHEQAKKTAKKSDVIEKKKTSAK